MLLRTWYLVLCAAPFLTTWPQTVFRKNLGNEAQQALWKEQKVLIPHIRAGEEDFADADIRGADLRDVDLNGINLQGA